MNRSHYFNYIEGHLHTLSERIKSRGKINLLDLHIYSENFFADMLNILFNLKLINLNATQQNVEGIDLVDEKNKIIAQISSTCTKMKIESSLEKTILKGYSGYRFKFVFIAGDAANLRKKVFKNPYSVLFDPQNDIIDVNYILKKVIDMPVVQQKVFYNFIKNELGNEIDVVKFDTNLAAIINILSNVNLCDEINSPEINCFEIDKKIEFNNLLPVKDTIDEYKVYYKKLAEKYTEFDKQGVNKSLSVFHVIKSQYTKLAMKIKSEPELFIAIVDKVIDTIVKSKNYIEIPYEELEICVYILVVDAFTRCKIFKNPEGYNYVITR